jgi:hypothetical protein
MALGFTADLAPRRSPTIPYMLAEEAVGKAIPREEVLESGYVLLSHIPFVREFQETSYMTVEA